MSRSLALAASLGGLLSTAPVHAEREGDDQARDVRQDERKLRDESVRDRATPRAEARDDLGRRQRGDASLADRGRGFADYKALRATLNARFTGQIGEVVSNVLAEAKLGRVSEVTPLDGDAGGGYLFKVGKRFGLLSSRPHPSVDGRVIVRSAIADAGVDAAELVSFSAGRGVSEQAAGKIHYFDMEVDPAGLTLVENRPARLISKSNRSFFEANLGGAKFLGIRQEASFGTAGKNHAVFVVFEAAGKVQRKLISGEEMAMVAAP